MFYKIKCDLLQSVMSLELQSLVLGRLLFMCDKFIFFIHLISLVEVIFGSFLYLKTILKWPYKYFAMAFVIVYMVFIDNHLESKWHTFLGCDNSKHA